MDFKNEAMLALDNVADRASSIFTRPTLRLGVTGLSRAGKTVFITSLVDNLINGGRLPAFKAFAGGRIARAYLEPQPDNLIARFQYEDHLQSLMDKRQWPSSTRSISELRLTLEFESESFLSRKFFSNKLSIDIVDYPGEWLLDLALMDKSFEDWCEETLKQAQLPNRSEIAQKWITVSKGIDPHSTADEKQAQELHNLFADYLRACRSDKTALSSLPPGRFLLPGDMEGAPALTFAPLHIDAKIKPEDGSWYQLMKRRFDAYKSEIVYPFFRIHFARLDRQVVLVDALQALNAGPYAMADLQKALLAVLSAFRPGKNSLFSQIIARKIDRILFLSTKADHVHHSDHTQLTSILSVLVEDAQKRAQFLGTQVKSLAISSIRATKEAQIKKGKEILPVLTGVPSKGEKIGDKIFDGKTKGAIFPGDLPVSANDVLKQVEGHKTWQSNTLNFIRFRPPEKIQSAEGQALPLPHIRMDETLEFLLGDKLA